jgi:hypothetical protein
MHNGPGPLQRSSCATVCVAREVKESSSLRQQNAADVEGFSKCFADRPHHRASSQRYKGGRERNEAVNADSRRAKQEARRWMRKRTAIHLEKGSWTPSNTLNRTKSRYIRATVKPIEYMATQPSAMIFWNFSQKTDTASSFCFPSTKSFVLYFERPVRLKAPPASLTVPPAFSTAFAVAIGGQGPTSRASRSNDVIDPSRPIGTWFCCDAQGTPRRTSAVVASFNLIVDLDAISASSCSNTVLMAKTQQDWDAFG